MAGLRYQINFQPSTNHCLKYQGSACSGDWDRNFPIWTIMVADPGKTTRTERHPPWYPGTQKKLVTRYFYMCVPRKIIIIPTSDGFHLTDDSGFGLKVTGKPVISTSAHNYGMEDIDDGAAKDQRHINDIVPRDFIEWNIDLKQMGVGGDNSWGAKPLDKYMIYPGEYSYEFTIWPVSGSRL